MTKESLKYIAESMKTLGINYQFKRWKKRGEEDFPYFVGEYQEVDPVHEDGMQETAFLLSGFARSKDGVDGILLLEETKRKIAEYFPAVAGRIILLESGSALAVYYAGSLSNLPTEDMELERMEINLTIKEWRAGK